MMICIMKIQITTINIITNLDDRAYTAALMAYYLSQKRLETVRNKVSKKKTNVDDIFKIKAPSSAKTIFA